MTIVWTISTEIFEIAYDFVKQIIKLCLPNLYTLQSPKGQNRERVGKFCDESRVIPQSLQDFPVTGKTAMSLNVVIVVNSKMLFRKVANAHIKLLYLKSN